LGFGRVKRRWSGTKSSPTSWVET